MQDQVRITAWLLETVRLMVDAPESVAVRLTDNDAPTLHVTVHPTDIGKVIGKQGRTARSLRTLVGAIAMAHGTRYALDIAEG